jgi:LacI family transcriptional regulator
VYKFMKENIKRVTLKDVAQHAGVSRATASMIVRNIPGISEKTRLKVLDSMKELGYIYDRVAANLRSYTSSMVGLIITEIGNPFFTEVMVGINNKLEKEGYTIFLGTNYDSYEKQEKLLSTMIENRVAGIILAPVSNVKKEDIDQIQNLGIPIVLIGNKPKGAACDYVGVNNILGAQIAVRHLVERGHRRIAYLGGPPESIAWKDRKEGYILALKEAGLPIDEALIIPSPSTREGGHTALQQVLQQSNRPTAIFCFTDIVATGVMMSLKEINLKPGRDVAIVGFDNIPEAVIVSPQLTTISSSVRSIGENAADLLSKRIKGWEVEQQDLILQPELIIRDSSSFIFK